jgi:predicted DNA-binding transcriptional regulator YafY
MKKVEFSDSELTALYKIIQREHENTFDVDYDGDDDFYDEDYFSKPIDKKTITAIASKINKVLPKETKKELDKEFLRKKYHPYNNQIDEQVYETLKKAYKELQTVKIKYFDMNTAEFIKRNVDVYYTSAKYTIGYCHLRKAIRKFRTSKIASAKRIDKNYTIPNDFNKNKY